MKYLKHHAQRLATGLLLGMCVVHFTHAATDCNQVTEIPVSECQELLNLYNSTSGDDYWTNNAGWNQTNKPCSWFGIVCDVGHVQKISLHYNGLLGSIPNLNLPNLQFLDLSSQYYGLRGSITNFTNLPKLQTLNLNRNELSGSVPNFTDLPNLKELDLGYNQLRGDIPNFNLPNLNKLILYANQLTGSIPNFNLPNLEELYLWENQLTGSIPNFTDLPNLQSLALGGNQLSGDIPSFTNLPNLYMLSLSGNQLSGGIPSFTNLPNLYMLSLSDNQLSGGIPNFGRGAYCGDIIGEINEQRRQRNEMLSLQ